MSRPKLKTSRESDFAKNPEQKPKTHTMKKYSMLGILAVALCGCGTVGKLSHQTVNTTADILRSAIGFGQNAVNTVIDKTQITGTNVTQVVQSAVVD